MPRTTQPARTYPKHTSYTAGPWAGMRDAVEPSAAAQGRAYRIRNMYATSSQFGREVVGIPGFELAGTQLGSSGNRVAQWIGQFTTSGGTTKSLAIVNGEIVEYDWSGDSYTVRIDATDLSGASITLSASARIHCVTFFDELIVSDGVNPPFAWDGTDGGGLTAASNAPALYGQPVVYYSKLFGILAADRTAIAWSEEGTWDTGYEAGGYTNAWTLGGTKGEALTALAASNDALTVVRGRSTTRVVGAVNDAFQTTGTRSAVSENTGTESPSAVLVLDEGIVLVDADCRPQFAAHGRGFSKRPEMWEDATRLLVDVPRIDIPNAQIVADDAAALLWVSLPTTASQNPALHLLFERTGSTPNLVGYVEGFAAQRMGVWIDDGGVPRLVHAGVDDGYLYVHGTPDGSLWNFGFAAGDQAIQHYLESEALGVDLDAEKHFDEISASFEVGVSRRVTVGYTTPRGTTTGQQVTVPTGGYAVLGSFILGTDTLGGASVESRARVGTNARGRYARLWISHAENDEPFSVQWMRATAFIDGREPAVP